MQRKRSWSSGELIDAVTDNGWFHVRMRGSHHIFKHPDRAEPLAIPHLKKNIPKGTALSILKTAGVGPKDLWP